MLTVRFVRWGFVRTQGPTSWEHSYSHLKKSICFPRWKSLAREKGQCRDNNRWRDPCNQSALTPRRQIEQTVKKRVKLCFFFWGDRVITVQKMNWDLKTVVPNFIVTKKGKRHFPSDQILCSSTPVSGNSSTLEHHSGLFMGSWARQQVSRL